MKQHVDKIYMVVYGIMLIGIILKAVSVTFKKIGKRYDSYYEWKDLDI